MDELIAFFKARLDEDEAVAREAASALPGDEGYGWRAVHRYLETHPASGESFIVDTSSELVAQPASARSYDRAVADHIARHDPARVLADVKADRVLLDKYAIGTALLPGQYKLGYCEALEEIITVRARRFRDHPGYPQAQSSDT